VIRFIMADLRRLWLGSAALVLLVALAAGLGIFVTLGERALRLGSARAADRFDLVVGAAGSDVQLVLSTVFLQPSPLPLMPGEVLSRLAQDPRVAWASPIGFGDSFGDRPVVGVTADLVTDGGRIKPAEGRAFARQDEAVAGSAAGLAMGDVVKPQHGLPGAGGHTHAEIAYTVVGVLPPTGTPWDRAILVPIEAVWHIHGLLHEQGDSKTNDGAGDEHDEPAPRSGSAPALGPPWPRVPPGAPAILVKPKGFAEAYRLRTDYRSGATMAVFPAEVLTRLYATLGDAKVVLAAIAAGAQLLVAGAVLLVAVMQVSQRQRQIAALRAFGASRASILVLIWLELFLLLALGLSLGLLLGWLAAWLASRVAAARTGVPLPVILDVSDAMGLLVLLAASGLLALAPAWWACRRPVASILRGT
jgi:putative ABC transport system permease protein